MWTTGPFEPDIAAQVQAELAGQGITAVVEARSYGETDGCGTYHHRGVDFSIHLTEKTSKQWSSQPGRADGLRPVLTKHAKPLLGNVKVFSSDGNLLSHSLESELSALQQSDARTFSAASLPADAITRKVYVIVYDPLLSNGQKLSQYLHWSDHATLTQQTIDFFKAATNNKMNYVVTETTIVTSGWPELIDGFRYTEEEYLEVIADEDLHHKPTEVNYNKIVNSPEFDICGKANRGELDEVWIYNGPWFGFYESTLVGPGGYWFNSSPVPGPHNCNRLIPIMGPSPERTVDEAVHNFTHRAEATMSQVYGGWQQNNTSHNWNKFALVKSQSQNYSYAGCGSSHFPPNGTDNYDYSNPSTVLSNCDDFSNYPNLSDPLQVSEPVDCTVWGCSQLGYFMYWFGQFPTFPSCGSDQVANDWWIYFANPASALSPSSVCSPDVHWISGNAMIPGVVLSYTDGITKTTMTDSFGNYSLAVANNWSGTIAPSKQGQTFLPAGRSYDNVAGNLIDQDFTTQGGAPISYYVDAATGNNGNACTSPAAPCRDIQETIGKANHGSVIYVTGGRYRLSTNGTPNVVILNKDVKLSGGWSSDFSYQDGASIIDGGGVNNGILNLTGTAIVEDFIVENSTSLNGGGIYIVYGSLTLKKSTVRNNQAGSNGAGIFLDSGTLTIINSTISGNRANGSGGGIYASLNSSAIVTIQNSTVAYNQASRGGGVSRANGTFNIINTIIANNMTSIASPDCEGTIAAVNFSLIENTSGCIPTSGNNNLHVDPQISSTLSGPRLVHMPMAGSPVIDTGTSSGCPATDQQGVYRPQGSGCDMGAVEYTTIPPTQTPTRTPTATPVVVSNGLYLSLTGSQTVGAVSSSDEDILKFDGTNWGLFFDGSDVGVGSPDLFAFSVLDADTILMAFSANVNVQGIAATAYDVLRFDATSLGNTTSGTWSMYFDGSDVGLDSSAEKIDSVTLLPDGRLLLSTTGNPAVPGLSGLADEDILAFTPISLGENTSGSWMLYFDGSDVGLSTSSGEDIDALDITANGDIYLSTLDNFSVTGVSGADEDVFVCTPLSLGSNTACTFSASLYFDGSSWGLSSNDVDAIHVLTAGSVLPSTPSATVTPGSPTVTLTPTATYTVTATGTPVSPSTATHTATPTSTLPNPPTATHTSGASNVIFADGFESGSLSAWSTSSTDAGDLSVSPAAALVGNQGLQAVIDDNNVLSVTSDHPNAEPHYLARFYFDPNSISMASGDAHIIVRGYSGSSTVALRVEVGYGASGYQIRAGLVNDGSTFTDTSWFPLTDSPHLIQVDWRAASGAGANNGGLVLSIDDVQKQLLTGIDNDTRRMDRVLLGALASIDTGTRGTYYFDAFEAER